MNRRRAFPVLAALATVLLVVGVVAAGAIERQDGSDDRVGAAAGLGASALLDDEATSSTTVTTVVVAPPAEAGTSTTTTTPPTTRTTLTRTTSPPPPPSPTSGPPPTGIPNIAPASSWSAERDGVKARLRIEPAAPVAGQAVRFFVDVSSVEPCCTILLDLGDGSGWSQNSNAACGSLAPGAKSATTSHTYASPGAYKATLTVMTGMACQPPLEPGQAPTLAPFHSVQLTACIAVGPGSAGQGGCSPFPAFGPDTVVSPVVDPFCQIRSDCTQASPPR
ncbi:MAG: PKD domain-containing protein [Actinomycetota bacterium]|nr:PKD domain-containing protein [Actinomycetota bacterium]